MEKTTNIREHHLAFQLSRTIVYEVEVSPSMFWSPSEQKSYRNGFHFSTAAEFFNRPKTDYNRCGQCQDDATKDFPVARRHFKKWDKHHLKRVTPELYEEWLNDLEELKATYNYIETKSDPRFWQVRELSMQKVKKPTNA